MKPVKLCSATPARSTGGGDVSGAVPLLFNLIFPIKIFNANFKEYQIRDFMDAAKVEKLLIWKSASWQ